MEDAKNRLKMAMQSIGSMEDAKNYPKIAMLLFDVWAGPVPGELQCVWDDGGVQMSPATHHMSSMDPQKTDCDGFSKYSPSDPLKMPKTGSKLPCCFLL
jgi:hypothetical protein